MILAIDPAGEPNGTTGFALYDGTTTSTSTLFHPKDETPEDFYKRFIEYLNEIGQDAKTLLIENFILYPKSSSRYFYSPIWTSELIGLVAAYCHFKSIKFIRRPTVGIKKIGGTLGINFETQHEQDAYTHLTLYREELENNTTKTRRK